ncbi:hypothetical protein A9G13_08790 [Gilliamella sp. wkB178]|uniref:hypothetical protein n=1 Tax=Gilliamella sp. wkB178 TaxID=3120259 RepID=UPI00080DE396|nr:hypothetical protein [Gilliamella apicola]OCG07070.1 hypothetical protein A9G13_08790 [Gilliamella apicola]
MQRITRIVLDNNDLNKMSLLDQYNFLLSFLKPHLTERTFSILPIPKLIDNNQYVGWYTHLEGQPVLLSSLTDEVRKKQIEETLKTRINDIEMTINSIPLTSEQQKLIVSWLPRIKSLGNQIYVINDDPVIVNSFEEPVLPKPAIVPPVTTSKTLWRWWHFLLIALLLIGFLSLLGLLWYLFGPSAKEKASNPLPEVVQPVEEKKPEIVQTIEPPKEQKVEPVVTEEPKVEPDVVAVTEPKIEPKPVPAPKEDPKPKVKNPPNCIPKQEIINNPNPSKMVLVFDNSLSMNVTLLEPPSEIEKYFLYHFEIGSYPNYMSRQDITEFENRMTRLPTRLSTSKKVALSSIDKIQQNVDISLVTLSTCPVADTTPFYNYANRGKLKSKINGLIPIDSSKSGTALYSGIEKASGMLDGVKRDDYILVISDGEDTCAKKNICTLVNYIAAQKPKLKINIVDIAGEHKIDCVANMTGGKVYIAQTPNDMIKQMNKAVSDMKLNRPVCK